MAGAHTGTHTDTHTAHIPDVAGAHMAPVPAPAPVRTSESRGPIRQPPRTLRGPYDVTQAPPTAATQAPPTPAPTKASPAMDTAGTQDSPMPLSEVCKLI